MIFFKPNFWDKSEVSFFSILLLPIALLVKLFGLIKYFLTKKHKSPIPTICIGNIYLGGTGKTPLSIEIFSILKDLQFDPSFIRKKYDLFKDEVELQKRIGPIYQHKRRVDAINEAFQNKSNIAILDDGFQDFSINKNLSIICFSEKQWIGNGLTIPAGPLRENLSALKRANLVVINGEKNIKIENKILKNNKRIKIFYVKYKILNIEKFINKKIIAFAGIGNPSNFFDLLQDNNINLIEKIKFPDHYNYTNKELDNLINKSKNDNIALLTTEKDYLRIDKNYRKKFNYLEVRLEIENKNQFIENIKKFI